MHSPRLGTKNIRPAKLHAVPSRLLFLALAAVLLTIEATLPLLGLGVLQAQWRQSTPRDTIYVPAHQKVPVQSHIPGKAGTKMEFFLSGTFGIFPGQDSTGFDARYMYSDSNWNAPYPLANPPSWNGTTYQVYLQVSNNYLLSDADSIHLLQTSYQPSHEYTAIDSGIGPPFEFRIFDRINQDSTGSDYALATGGLHIRMAQYTAGISVQYRTLSFPLTSVGTSSTLSDSIASYGLDALEVDSVWISGPQQSEFGFSSLPQRATPFTLSSESANKFTISYSPSQPNSLSTDTLFLRCPNAENGERLTAIVLTGMGAAPNGSIGPDTLDFYTVRVNYTGKALAHGFNAGKAPWIIDSITLNPPADAAVFSWNLTMLPYPVASGSQINIQFSFTPLAARPYEATATIWTQDGKKIPIVLIGTGATPVFTVLQPSLNFGTLLTNSSKVMLDTVRNDGQWPAHITRVSIGGPGKQFYSFENAADSSGFVLDAGATRYYSITYHPKFAADDSEFANLEFDFDDRSQPKLISLAGWEKRPRISYDTNSINFGNVKVNTSSERELGVQNASGSPTPFTATFSFYKWFSLGPSKNFFNPGADSLPILFTPPYHGLFSNWLYLSCNGQYDSVYLYGFGVEPHPVFDPANLDFGICQDYNNYVRGTTLIDTGDYPLAICDVKIVGPDASEFSLLPLQQTPSTGSAVSLPDTLRAGRLDTLYFPVNFTTHALAGRDHYATLEVLYCDGTMDTIPLHAKEEDQYIQFCSYKIDFGKIRVGTHADTTVCFFNGASVALPVDSIWITRNGLPFTLAHDSISVPTNGISLDSATFTPLTRGTFTGMLHGSGGGMKEDSIVITGIGAQSAPMLSTKQLDLGMEALTDTSIPQWLSLQDTGDWPLLAQIEKINDPYNEFSVTIARTQDQIDPVGYDTIPIGGTSFYSVAFTPWHQELPDHESELVFHYDDGTVDTVLLIGHDTSNFLAFDRDTIDFGKVRLKTPPVTFTLPLALVNTSSAALTALALSTPAAPFSANPAAPITVQSQATAPMQVSFRPNAIGKYTSSIIGEGSPFNPALRDTVFLVGSGAAPMPTLSTDTLDFDTVALGHSVTRQFTLSNLGNWPLVISRSPVMGPNASDFTPIAIATDTTINDSEQAIYSISFTGSTPLQLTPRLGLITWTLDDGSTFQLVLRACDVPPYRMQIGFPHAYWGRPGDKIAAELDLQSAIPDTLAIQHIRGTVTFDPAVVDGPEQTGGVQPGALVPTPQWNTVIHYVQPNAFSYDISSTTDTLSKAGTLLNFIFKLHSNLTDGASSPLIGYDTVPDTYEAIATQAQSTVFLDSNCGTIHLIAGGAPIASFIRQNTPNPFGAMASTTTLPFEVGADNTIVTIRLLDPTGREVMRPVDHQSFARGRYEVTIGANTLSAGIYFYEFQAGSAETQVGKMVVE